MALDPEELRRKRADKAYQRKLQQTRRRKLRLRLGIAAAVLLLCGGLIFYFASRPPQSPDSGSSSGPIPPVKAASETQSSPTTTIHLAFGGDLNITDGTVGAGGTDYVYKTAFQDVAALLADADAAALNLEGILCGEPYGTDSRSAPQGLMDSLSKAGVDMIQLANSYSIYNGTSGLFSTIDSVRAAGMLPLGVTQNQNTSHTQKSYTIVELQGIRVAFVAFTKGMDGMALPEGSKNCVNVLYKDYDSTYQSVDTEGITQVLDAIEAEKPDITVAMLHWGSEYNDTISKSQEKIVKLMQKHGVDAIVGGHSHYVQRITYDRALGRLVAYSLGDFFGDASRSGSEYSIILDLEVTKDHTTGETKISGFSFTPIYTDFPQGGSPRVLRIREAMAAYEGGYLDKISEETYKNMAYALERIDARVKGLDS